MLGPKTNVGGDLFFSRYQFIIFVFLMALIIAARDNFLSGGSISRMSCAALMISFRWRSGNLIIPRLICSRIRARRTVICSPCPSGEAAALPFPLHKFVMVNGLDDCFFLGD